MFRNLLCVVAIFVSSVALAGGGGVPTWKDTTVACTKQSDCKVAMVFNKCIEDTYCRGMKPGKKGFCRVQELVCDDNNELTVEACDPSGPKCVYEYTGKTVCDQYECWNDKDCMGIGEICIENVDNETGLPVGSACYPTGPAPCEIDMDCTYLGGNACTAWSCTEKVCTPYSYTFCTMCDTDADCAKGVGVPFDGWTCNVKYHKCVQPEGECWMHTECSDGLPCTQDWCMFDYNEGYNVCMNVSACFGWQTCEAYSNGGFFCTPENQPCTTDVDCDMGGGAGCEGDNWVSHGSGCVSGACVTKQTGSEYCPNGCGDQGCKK